MFAGAVVIENPLWLVAIQLFPHPLLKRQPRPPRRRHPALARRERGDDRKRGGAERVHYAASPSNSRTGTAWCASLNSARRFFSAGERYFPFPSPFSSRVIIPSLSSLCLLTSSRVIISSSPASHPPGSSSHHPPSHHSSSPPRTLYGGEFRPMFPIVYHIIPHIIHHPPHVFGDCGI